MKKSNSYNFDNSYRVRVHIIFLIKKIFVVAIVFSILGFFTNFLFLPNGSSLDQSGTPFFIPLIFLIISLFVFLYLVLSWNYEYFVVSPSSISSNYGIILRKTHNIDIPSVRSISVNQSFFGRVFGYGTLTFESPLLKEDFLMVNLPNPFRHSSLINNARLEAINKSGGENIVIAK